MIPTHLFRTTALIVLTVFLSCEASAQVTEDPAALIARVQKQYDRIDDYRVNVNVVVDMTGLSVPEMTAVLYFRKPDRIHIESDGFAMLPRDAVAFRPTMFNTEQYDMVIQGTAKIHGKECVKVRMFARSDTIRLQRAMLFIDQRRDVILRADIDPGEGASAQVTLSYTRVDGSYWLPRRIDVIMESPMRFRRQGLPSKPQNDNAKDEANITVTYSNYIVNKGIPDSV
ncbi:MAG: hypothetical protein JXA28_14685, partial [Bacteroidetes bacterium]|nr:hypothetical protein [Bacteroidota bacterium]